MAPSSLPATALDVLQPYHLWLLMAALAVTIMVTPIVRAIAISRQIYDLPDAGLKPHDKPIPYLGGLAIYLGWAAGLLAAMALVPAGQFSDASRSIVWYLLAGGTLMMLTGLIDDLFDLSPRTKLLCELSVAGLLLYGGIGRKVALVFWGWTGIVLPEQVLLTASFAITVFIVMGAGNATNLIDGLDGLCSGVTGILSIGFVVIAAHLALYSLNAPSAGGDLLDPVAPVRLIVSLSLLGACLGFLRYNFNPAQVFMGDAGSLLLGFNAAAMLLLFADRGILRWFIGACMVFSLPVFDTALAITRRWLNGRPLFKGDRSHFYDQLRDRGYSVRQTVLICYVLTAALAAIGCLVLFIRTRYALLIFVGVVLTAIATVIRMGMLRMEPRKPEP